MSESKQRFWVEGHGSGEPPRLRADPVASMPRVDVGGAPRPNDVMRTSTRSVVTGPLAQQASSGHPDAIQRSLDDGSGPAMPASSPVVVSMGDTIHIRSPENPDVRVPFQIPHPTATRLGTPHDFGSSLLSPPEPAFTDHEGVKAHVRRLIQHVKDYASRVHVRPGGAEGKFLDDVVNRF